MTKIFRQSSRIRNLGDLETVLKSRVDGENLVDITPLQGDHFRGDASLVGTETARIYFGDYNNFRAQGVISKNQLAFGIYLATDGNSKLYHETISNGDIGFIPFRTYRDV